MLLVGSGMVVCGLVTDRIGRDDPTRRWTTTITYCLVSLVCLGAGFALPAGPGQLALLGVGAFFAAGSSGPAAAMVAGLTHGSVRASAMGTLTVANNVLGLALGPVVVGVLADHLGLGAALKLAPLAYVGAIVAFLWGRRRMRAAVVDGLPGSGPAREVPLRGAEARSATLDTSG